jgi:hypothetical protein
MSTLKTLVDQVAIGRGSVGWVGGEPGIGKSTLIKAMIADALASGCAVARGAGEELMQAFPLRLWSECLGVSGKSSDPARVEIASLLRGEAGESGTMDPVLAAGERLLALVDRLCSAGPLVLVLEDLHWADEPSLLLWNRLARSVDQIPLLLVGTSRPVPYRPTVERLRSIARERVGAYLELGTLDHGDVVDMAGRLAAGAPGPKLSEELLRAGGNPLYVRELVEALVRDGLVEVINGVAELRAGAGATPASLTAAIGRRLVFLTDDTIKALRMAALLGKEFDVGHWQVVTDRSAPELADAAEEATAAGVVTEAGQYLAFRHDVIRQVLVDQIPMPVRAGLHRHAAQQLARAGASVDVVAGHLVAAPGSIDGWVAEWLAQSSESMLYGAPEVSAELLTRVVDALERSDQHWVLLASRLARVLFRLGRGEQCEDVAGELLRHTTDVELSAELRALMLRSAGRARRYEDALALGELALADEQLPLRWRARLGAWPPMALALLGRQEQARARALDALRDAQGSADPLAVGYALHTLVYVSRYAHWLFAPIKAALAGLADDAESMDLRLLLMQDRIGGLFASGRSAEAQAGTGEVLVMAERAGTLRSVSSWPTPLLTHHHGKGRCAAARGQRQPGT